MKYSKAFEDYWSKAEGVGYATDYGTEIRIKSVAYRAWVAGSKYSKKVNKPRRVS